MNSRDWLTRLLSVVRPDQEPPVGADTTLPTAPPVEDSITRIVFDTRSVWRAAWVVVAVLLLTLLGQFVCTDGGSLLFLLVMSFFFALAMEPAVARLAGHVNRKLATIVVMLAVALFIALFIWQFGSLLFDQLAALVVSVPSVAATILEWVNNRFNTDYRADNLLDSLGMNTSTITGWASQVAGGVFGAVSSALTAALGTFALVFFTYYISAGMPALRGWVAGLFRPRLQVIILTVWELMLTKVGGYVAARLVLAVISAAVHGTFMYVVGMPQWLPLAIWTGLVAQFVPNVGTYIAIVLPVIVGLTSDDTMRGIYVLLFAIAYQQVENLTIEPRISARAVDVHPAVSFASALLGAQLFGVAGAALGVPVAATLIALLDIYKQRYEVTHLTEAKVAAVVDRAVADEEAETSGEDPSHDGRPVVAEVDGLEDQVDDGEHGAGASTADPARPGPTPEV